MSIDDLSAIVSISDPWWGADQRGTKPTPGGVVLKGFSLHVDYIEARYQVPFHAMSAGYLTPDEAAQAEALHAGSPFMRRELIVMVTAHVQERDTGRSIPLTFTQHFDENFPEPEAVR